MRRNQETNTTQRHKNVQGGPNNRVELPEAVAAVSTLLTVPEAAEFLRISRNLAYDMIARGEFPHVRLGRVIRVPSRALQEWLECSTVHGVGRAAIAEDSTVAHLRPAA